MGWEDGTDDGIDAKVYLLASPLDNECTHVQRAFDEFQQWWKLKVDILTDKFFVYSLVAFVFMVCVCVSTNHW